MKAYKVTPLFVVLILLEIVLIGSTINYLFINNSGGMALAGVISLIAAIINLLIIALEQMIATYKTLNFKYLCIVEIIIILTVATYTFLNGISIG